MIKRHPEPDMLVEYTAGSLSKAPCISVTAHLQFCEQCSDSVKSLKEIGGELLTRSETVAVSGGLLEAVLAKLDSVPAENARRPASSKDEVTADLPRFVQGILPAGALTWRRLSPSLKVALVSVGEDTFELALHRIDAGGKAPEHDHQGTEITVVLKGSFSDEDGVYQPGDFIIREPGDTHRPFAARNEECICLSVLAAPIRMTGIKRLLNPFLRFSPS